MASPELDAAGDDEDGRAMTVLEVWCEIDEESDRVASELVAGMEEDAKESLAARTFL